MRKLIIGAITTAFLATTATAMAQTNTAQPRAQFKARTAASMECSKQADAKGLHGKPRKAFRTQCLKGMKTKA